MIKKSTISVIPRILAILFILFISLFALDVFGEDLGFLNTAIALFMHLIPSLVLTGLLILAWKKPKLGGGLFILLSFIFTLAFNTYREPISFLLITGLPLLIGLLFMVSEKKSNQKKRAKKAI